MVKLLIAMGRNPFFFRLMVGIERLVKEDRLFCRSVLKIIVFEFGRLYLGRWCGNWN